MHILQLLLTLGIILNSALGGISHAQGADLRATLAELKSATGWESIIDSDGIRGFRKKEPGSAIYAVKGYADVEGSLERIASAAVDPTHTIHWVQGLKIAKIVAGQFPLPQPGIGTVIFHHFITPFIIHDREFLSHMEMQVDPEHRILCFFYTPTEFSYPAHPPTVRGTISRSTIAITPSSTPGFSTVLTEFHGDPKGSIPAWMVNQFQRQWPKTTLLALRKYVKAKEITVLPSIHEVFLNK